jgi:hypothetical protein
MKKKYLLSFSIIAVLSFIMASSFLSNKEVLHKTFTGSNPSGENLTRGHKRSSIRNEQEITRNTPKRRRSLVNNSQIESVASLNTKGNKNPIIEAKKAASLSNKASESTKTENKKEKAHLAKNNMPAQIAVSGRIPRVLTVTEDGKGDSFLFREALRVLGPGDKILLKKGNYKFQINDFSLADLIIAGEGEESVLEVSETIEVAGHNLEMKNLKVQHYGTGVALSVFRGKKLLLENVFLHGNGSDGIRVKDGHLDLSNLKIQNMQFALELHRSLSFKGRNIEISNSDFGLHYLNNNDLTIDGLKTSNIISNSIFFSSGSKGKLTCKQCKLGENATNHTERLIYKSDESTSY